jgi:tripartite-type tricarboxylate transporter receptor subunit TctC
MKLPRRQFLHLATGAAAVPAVPRFARGQTYPSQPVRLIVGFAPGGPTDISARVIGQWLSERLGQAFVVENRPGGGSNLATEAVVRAAADGYTLLVGGIPNAVNATLYDKLNFNFIRDMAAVASISRDPLVFVVHPSVPASTVPELIAYAKARPGHLSYGSGGIGTPSHLAGELFKMMTGINMVHVPYRGAGPGIAALLGGQVEIYLGSTVGSLEHVRTGKLHALAVTTMSRLEALLDVPTVADFVPGFEVSGWQGLVAPKSTPTEIINKLNLEINAGLADPKIKARFADLGSIAIARSPGDFGRFITDETERWGKVIRAANIKAE